MIGKKRDSVLYTY